LNNASSDLERLRDAKDQEILILQEGMDSTLQQLSETQQASNAIMYLPIIYTDIG
jgi:huntingtin-interacting protein 1-related protein